MMDSPHKISVTLRSVLREAAETLSSNHIEQARLESEILLAHFLGLRKEDIIIYSDQELTDPQEEKFQQLVERRCRKEPLAYIVGHREFWSLEFKVNPKVLIPRPETEGVVERLLNLAGDETSEKVILMLDVGTGSGILAIVAALEFPKARITAVDNSGDALEVARENALWHQVAERIEFLEMDLMRDWDLPKNDLYDYIFSNPPYIPSRELKQLMPDVRDYEPREALDGGPDGLACYRCIVANAFPYLKPGGHLIFEVGDDQAGPVQRSLQAHGGLDEIEIVQDLSGRDRVVSARRAIG
ncbi:MAG: peptide chain release factor N(5)-glutamine methyltransferase [Nitrospinaceae bacterium]